METREADGRPSETLMPLTRQLADALADDDGARVLAQLQRLGLATQRVVPPTASPSRDGSGVPTPVGVWRPERDSDGRMALVRDPNRREAWRFWADIERIAPKRAPRVILLGESAARGYFYDPALTPAAILGDALAGAEVIDLAASDLTAPSLESLFAALPVLEPDAVVLFAGNNWHSVLYTLEDLGRLADALRGGGQPAVRAEALEIVVARARATLDALAAAARGVPIVVMVPEFDLADWRSEPSALAPVLAQGRNVRWMAARDEARGALASGDLETCAERARELIALDGGTCALGYELLGDVARARGDIDTARAALEAARDAVCGTFLPYSPRCPRVVQDVLRATATQHGFAVVDLPRLFSADLTGDLPDRRLFLDYCHLTTRGMAVAMSAAAGALAPRLGLTPSKPHVSIAPADEATAHVLAAVHNAHYGQGPEIVRHHLRRAVDLSDSAREQLRWYVDVHRSGGEQWMSASFDRLCESALVRRYLAATDPRVMGRLADSELADAMSDTLGEPHVAHAHDARSIDLLEPRYHARTFRERSGSSHGPDRGYHQAHDVVSRFVFPGGEIDVPRVRLTCRVPTESDADAEIVVRLNDSTLDWVRAGRSWVSVEIDLPSGALREGTNELRIDWPLLEPRWVELLESAARRLERAVFPDALPAYGDIHELRISDARVASPPL